MVSLLALERIATATARLDHFVTAFSLAHVSDGYIEHTGGMTPELERAGIRLEGNPDCTIILPKSVPHYGNIALRNHGSETLVLFGPQPEWARHQMSLRFDGNRGTALFPRFGGVATLPEISFRSDDQVVFWGIDATSVWSKIEVEGAGRIVAIGDGCMMSSGVWIRNHDMHVIFDLETGEPISSAPTDVIVERHVWFAFDSVVNAAPRIGYGSILAARSFVTSAVPPKSLVVGVPGRVVRTGVSWGRHPTSVPNWLKSVFEELEQTGRRRDQTE